MSAPSPMDLIEAVCTVLRTTDTAGVVVPDPVYSDDLADYPRMLATAGPDTVDGWLVGLRVEEPEIQSSADGGEQYVRLFCDAMMSVETDSTGCPSRALFGQKIEDAKQALRDSPDLGLSGDGVAVRHERLYAPEGYQSLDVSEFRIHVAPMELRVFVRFC